ncbi:MAG: HemK2/MTQ2 family protein methyltransferase [Candidatus Micrarchaeia archaeon]
MEFDKIRIKACESVYEPREDSYLLAQEVEKYAFGKVLDLGTGTGIQGIVAAKKGCDVTFSDVSEKALECAKSNAKLNNVKGDFVASDMFSNIKGKFNTILFNPPYLPSEEIKDIALDGGKDGRMYIDEFLHKYKDYLDDNYVVLLLESSFNNYEKDINENARVVASGHFFFEDIVVIMFSNNPRS